ncbi:BACON domain-containing protein [uncultured Alistipes sp.]|uniref:BACON domain-containing protein n=1 Tax=uncultured Alistipes sp. TaxID=538949 RepID=UPI0025873A18|nr:BACON domain-containing carbohydrate-binding protein [uncultured Alistipes sp.]
MKLKSYIAVSLCAFALAGCSDDDRKIGVTVDGDTIEIGAEGGTRNIKVTADDAWIATTNDPWITISPANGRGSAQCRIIIDSALRNEPRQGIVRIQNQNDWEERRDITVSQDGYDYAITLDDKEINVSNYAAYDDRSFDVRVKTNVDFDIEIPEEAQAWLTAGDYKVELDRGLRPREVTVRFNWGINSRDIERNAVVKFRPKDEVTLARQDELSVNQNAAEPIEEDTRAGDSVALLAIARSLNMWESWETNEKMDNWDNVVLWEEGMDGYTPEKAGRVKFARFSTFGTKEGLPFEVQYLTAADELVFFSNTNWTTFDLSTGEYITKLGQLRRLTISGYGLVDLDPDFKNLKNLESLDISVNNFEKIPEVLTKENFPKLHALYLNTCQRGVIYDLSNTTTTHFGGLFEETDQTREFPRRLLEWDNLDTLTLSVNYLQGRIPDMKDYAQKYTQADISAADSLPQALVGTPKVLPNIKRFSINLNRLTGELPEWLLHHPALDWMDPFTLVFTQEGKDQDGKLAGFTNEPVNLDEYYRFYEGKKYLDPNKKEE